MDTLEKTFQAAKYLSTFFPSVTFTQEDVKNMASIMTYQTAQKGEFIVKQGQITDSIYYLESGLCRQFYYKNGHDVTEHFTSDGYMFYCIESLYQQTPTELMAEALESSVYYLISYPKLQELALRFDNIARWLFKIYELEGIISQQQADSLRFETSKERYESFVRQYPEVAKRAPIRHIASYLAMSRESLSRVRAGKL